MSKDEFDATKNMVKEQVHKWIYVGYVRAHTHDVRALPWLYLSVEKVCQYFSCMHLFDLPVLVLTQI